MKFKKYLAVLLLSVACICLGFAFGCKDDKKPTGDTKFKVIFVAGENFKYKMGAEEFSEKEEQVVKGESVTFSLVVDEGYRNPLVKSNDTVITAANGVYSVQVNSDITVTASVSEIPYSLKVSQDENNNSYYVISTVKDLQYMARFVNSGVSDYVLGSYQLENDIDCGGATLDVIGDFTTQYSYFAGVFDGKGHTVSNFKINPGVGTEYVGFFGCVQANSNSQNSGLIQNLNLDNFEITASAASDGNVCVGSFIGFSAGANLVACSATRGSIKVNASVYFSYAGGAIGILRSVTLESGGIANHYFASCDYVSTDVTITAANYVLAAGGIVGYAFADSDRGAATIVNCYATGDIWYAMRTGGIVGWLDDYASVTNCYADGNMLSADAHLASAPPDTTDSPEFYNAYSGGIVAYAGLNTIVANSFSTSELEAKSNNAQHITGNIVAGYAPKTDFEQAIVIKNCHYGSDSNGKNANWIKNTLKWNDVDWIIKDGSLPVTNLESTEEFSFNITFNYGAYKVSGASTGVFPINIQQNSYTPLSFYLGEELKEYVSSDNGLTAYGYYFDDGFTQRVPYSYVPTGDATLYLKFIDYSEVAGTYYYEGAHGRTVKIELSNDGKYNYVDTRPFTSSYYYDGEKIVFYNGLFAKLSNVNWENTPQLDVYFTPYSYVGVVTNEGLKVYDGTYFTVDKPLTFSKTAPIVNSDGFKGKWEKSATLSSTYYEFDGNGNWTYSYKGTTTTGRYSVSNGVATLGNGKTAKIDASGLLSVNGEYFRLENSFYGLWRAQSGANYIYLNGFGSGLAGSAGAVINGLAYEDLIYVKDGFFDALTNDNEHTFTILSGNMLFGYFVYVPNTNIVNLYAYDSETAQFLNFVCSLVDDYEGDWIGEESIGNVTFEIVNFNGLGTYKVDGDGSASLGYITINGEKVKYEYECTVGTLNGTFEYKGEVYSLVYNDDGTVTITKGAESATVMRKDVMFDMPLVDGADNVYSFNGGGKLTGGGILTVTDKNGRQTAVYGYKIVNGTVDMNSENPVTDIEISIYQKGNASNKLGTITVSGYKFILKLNGQSDKELDLYLPFTGKTWAISIINNSFYIGKFDLSYESTGVFNGTENVPYVYFPEYNYIYVFYGNSMGQYVRIYLLLLDDGTIVVSSYPYMVSGDYHFAAPADEFFGKWTNTNANYQIEFDGLADSMYAVGVAFDYHTGDTYLYTRRFGKTYMWIYDNEEVAYVLETMQNEMVGDNVFTKDTGSKYDRLRLTECDVLNKALMTAYKGNEKYEFFFDGTVKFGGKTGEYLIDSVNGDFTTLVIKVSGQDEVTVVVDHEERTVKVVD